MKKNEPSWIMCEWHGKQVTDNGCCPKCSSVKYYPISEDSPKGYHYFVPKNKE